MDKIPLSKDAFFKLCHKAGNMREVILAHFHAEYCAGQVRCAENDGNPCIGKNPFASKDDGTAMTLQEVAFNFGWNDYWIENFEAVHWDDLTPYHIPNQKMAQPSDAPSIQPRIEQSKAPSIGIHQIPDFRTAVSLGQIPGIPGISLFSTAKPKLPPDAPLATL